MDSQNTTMHDLAASLKKARDDIDALYRKLGSRLLRREEAEYGDSQQDAPESLSDWKKLMGEREEAASAVIEIKDNLKRAQALKKTEKDFAKSLADAKKKMRSSGLSLVSALWDIYSPERFPSFAPVYDAAKAEKAACQEIEEKQRSVSSGVEEGKRLSKMMAQFKGAGLSAQLYYRKNRFEQAAADALEALVAGGGVGRLAEELRAADLPRLLETLAPFSEAANEFLFVSESMKNSDSEKQSVDKSLKAHGASENPSRRLDALRATIKEKDAAIDNICYARGKDYAALFLDAEGKPLSGAAEAASDEAGDDLLEIAGLLAQSAELERQMEILKTQANIRQLDKAIAGHNAEIDSLKKKIESMTGRIENLEKTIDDISSEKAGLQSYLEKIAAGEDARLEESSP